MSIKNEMINFRAGCKHLHTNELMCFWKIMSRRVIHKKVTL